MLSKKPPDDEDDEPELKEQIREGYEAYLRGEGRPFDEFMAELEAELNQDEPPMQSAADGFREAWEELQRGEARPINDLWG